MVKVEFTGLRDRLLTLDRLEREQLPFAAALALTRTAQATSAGLRAEMQRVFDRPTRATLNSLFIESAPKEKMVARVWINDGKGRSRWGEARAAIRWLEPQVYGGPRGMKGVEKMLQRRGVLGAGQFVVPGEAAPLDQHGNIKRGQLNRILSGARLFTEEGYTANRTDSAQSRRKRGDRYFVIRKGREALGIAERKQYGKGSKNSIRMVLVFARQPAYARRFDFHAAGDRIASEELPIEFEKAMAQALATRRR